MGSFRTIIGTYQYTDTLMPQTARSGSESCRRRGHPPPQRDRRWCSLLVGQKLPVQHDHDAVTSRVRHALDVETEIDGTHDVVAELLVDEFLDRRTKDL